ncbi:MAG TPA: hypothetical protein VHC21_03925 [Candidatus Saccharimonadales bacterium]|nr:hypothetical protein [Candidatus Saccharimonadales bacterium]
MALFFALAFLIFFIVGNSFPNSNKSAGAGMDTMSHTSLALLLGIYVFFQLAMVSYLASLVLSIWNAIKWLDRGGRYFWTSAAVFFSDVAVIAWVLIW